MAAKYTYKINGEEVAFPENWASLVFGYAFDGKVAGPTELPLLRFCDNKIYEEWIAQLNEVACFEAIFSVCYACKTGADFEDIFYTRLRYRDVTLDCNTCILETPSKRPSALADLNEISSDEICINANTEIELFQYQSGGYYCDQDNNPTTGNFIRLVDLVNQMAERATYFQWEEINGLACNDSALYAPAKAYIEPPAVPVGETVLTIEGEFGQVITVTLEDQGWGTVEEYLESICNALCYVETGFTLNAGTNIIMQNAWEFHQSIGTCNIVDGILEICSYWDYESVNLTVGGAVPAWYTENIVPQAKSSRDIFISADGLTGNQVCATWEQIQSLICKTQGAYVRESYIDQQFEFKKYDTIKGELPTTGVFSEPITDIDANSARKSFDLDWWVSQFNTGWAFRTDDFGDTGDETWEWQGVKFEGPIQFPMDGCLTLNQTCPNPEIQGKLVFTNIGPGPQYVVINLIYKDSLGNETVIDSQQQELPVNVPTEFLIGSANYGFPRIGSMPDIIEAGEEFCVQWQGATDGFETTGAGINIDSAESYWFISCNPCFDYPFLNEDSFYEQQNGILDRFRGCKGTKDCVIDSKFYGGLGFALSQQIQGLADYSDTNFLTYVSPGNQARRFEKCFYFAEDDLDICEEYRGNRIPFYYYNAPLQLPNMISGFLSQIPSGVEIPAYQYEINVDAAGNIARLSRLEPVVIEDTEAPQGCLINFEVCSKPDDVIAALLYGAKNIDICGENGTGIIRSFDFNVETSIGRYQILI